MHFRSFSSQFVLLSLVATLALGEPQFEPYQLNGGLVAAAAGKDFVLIACDTRLIGEGSYDILERNHVRSRLWAATPDDSSPLTTADAAVRIQERTNSAVNDEPAQVDYTLNDAPVFVGSAGCSADCEELKRTVRADLVRARYFSECALRVHQVATLLSQVLYSRRFFPFYSFCVVAGLSQTSGGAGQVYTYDAIGSYEQVAVATAGTGRELLQPILDRKFQSLLADADEVAPMANTGTLVGAGPTRMVAPACSKMVACSQEEAVKILVEAFRDVSEREIGVGDQVVLCALRRNADGKCLATLYQCPLKTH